MLRFFWCFREVGRCFVYKLVCRYILSVNSWAREPSERQAKYYMFIVQVVRACVIKEMDTFIDDNSTSIQLFSKRILESNIQTKYFTVFFIFFVSAFIVCRYERSATDHIEYKKKKYFKNYRKERESIFLLGWSLRYTIQFNRWHLIAFEWCWLVMTAVVALETITIQVYIWAILTIWSCASQAAHHTQFVEFRSLNLLIQCMFIVIDVCTSITIQPPVLKREYTTFG